MPKYLFHGSYGPEAVQGVIAQGGSARRQAATTLIESLGGTLESFHFAFGTSDFYGIAELPDNAAAAAVATSIGATGRMSAFETVVLLTPEEMDAAVERNPEYHPPGG